MDNLWSGGIAPFRYTVSDMTHIIWKNIIRVNLERPSALIIVTNSYMAAQLLNQVCTNYHCYIGSVMCVTVYSNLQYCCLQATIVYSNGSLVVYHLLLYTVMGH